GICEIEKHDLPDGRVLLVCSEIADNPGQSITNCIELIARQLAHQLEIAADNLVVLEHFAGFRREEWHLVSFEPPADFDAVGTPKWHEVTPDDWQEYGLRPRKRRVVRKPSRSLLISEARKPSSRLTSRSS